MGQLSRPSFDSVREYGQIFTAAVYWRPYVAEVCARHDLGTCREVRSGRPGTFPVFIVEDRVVVKLFGDLFKGGARFRIEREMYKLLGRDRAIPAPAFVASGALFVADSGWPWPYIVTDYLPGVSVSEVFRQLSLLDLADVCRFLAPVVRRIHDLTPAPSSPLSLTWKAFDRFLVERRRGCAERHSAWGTLPARLVAQIDDYLPSLADLVDRTAAPQLLHCDLNADHVLGTSWASAGGRSG